VARLEAAEVSSGGEDGERWSRHDRQWRDPAQVVSLWREASESDPRLLEARAHGAFWEVLAERRLSLLVTREYEHLVLALSAPGGAPQVSYLRLPHPSGVAVDPLGGVVHVACTRNPNQVVDLAAVDPGDPEGGEGPLLLPLRSSFLPGGLYLHDLALVGGVLHGNAVGQNAVVALPGGGAWRRAWWPRCIEGTAGPDFSRNYLQLNSIAAGESLETSFYTASSATISARRPGHRNFAVDGRGVVFAGSTREPVATGLTRPHSARLRAGELWVANSGYGELVRIEQGKPVVVARLPGWTRGLWLGAGIALVGTSRVIRRFRAYAPGLDVEASVCGVHLVDLASGAVRGSLVWPGGNQIFAIEALPAPLAAGFPFTVGRGRGAGRRARAVFGSFSIRGGAETTNG